MPEIIKFKYTTAPYGWLSNFHPTKVIYDNLEWATREHLYQALKHQGTNQDLYLLIQKAPTPKAAKFLAYSKSAMPTWNDIKVDQMTNVLGLSVAQHDWLKTALINTFPSILVEESSKDSFWGNGKDGLGQNILGRLWMKIRDECMNLQ